MPEILLSPDIQRKRWSFFEILLPSNGPPSSIIIQALKKPINSFPNHLGELAILNKTGQKKTPPMTNFGGKSLMEACWTKIEPKLKHIMSTTRYQFNFQKTKATAQYNKGEGMN